MTEKSLLSLEARQAIHEERRARIEKRKVAKRIESLRLERAANLRAAEASHLATELEVAGAVIPNPHQPIPTPWTRSELVVLAAVTLVSGMLGMLGGLSLLGLLTATLGACTLLLARRLACASLESGFEPRPKLHTMVVSACSIGFGLIVGGPLGGWTAVLVGAFAALLLLAAAVAFSSPWLFRSREMWRARDTQHRRVALERAASVHLAHAERLRQETQADPG